jgi:two-component system sensor histidine kinase AlgZ
MRAAFATIVDTWAGLLAPRRALAICALVLPMLYAQSVWNANATASIANGLLLCVATVILAPAAWRLLEPAGVLVAVPVYVVVGVVAVGTFGVWLPRHGGFEDRILTDPASLPLLLGLFGVGGFGLGRDIAAERALTGARARADALVRDKERAELLALRAQLDPHFLFNTLNAIAEWCATDPAVAEQAIIRLSGVLRTVMAAVPEAAWPLADELALCASVLELHRIRDPDRFACRVEGTADARVPPMILLPLVENAVKHGPAAGHPGEVVVSVGVADGRVRVDVRNPGPFGGPRDGGQGLALVRRRLELAYDGKARLDIGTDGGTTLATVVFP